MQVINTIRFQVFNPVLPIQPSPKVTSTPDARTSEEEHDDDELEPIRAVVDNERDSVVETVIVQDSLTTPLPPAMTTTTSTSTRRIAIQPATTPDPTATQSPFHPVLKPGIFAGASCLFLPAPLVLPIFFTSPAAFASQWGPAAAGGCASLLKNLVGSIVLSSVRGTVVVSC